MTDVARSDWAIRIALAWRKSVDAVLEAGRLLKEAKDALDHGAFLEMIENDLPFGARAAQMLMKIADDPRITNANHGSHLPPSWRTLYELTKLNDEQFVTRLATGVIHPEMERRDVVIVEKQERRVAREVKLAAKIVSLPQKRYGAILADPEWRFEPWSRETGMDRAADNHYPTSTLDLIKSREVASIAADDCVLFLWSTAPMQPQAYEVMAAWGFAYKSQVVWDKGEMGTGYWFRNCHEVLLVGTRGKIPAPAPGTQWLSVVHAPVGAHSEKPEVFYELIEAYFPHLPKIELNARRRRHGWDAWGLEAPEDEAALA